MRSARGVVDGTIEWKDESADNDAVSNSKGEPAVTNNPDDLHEVMMYTQRRSLLLVTVLAGLTPVLVDAGASARAVESYPHDTHGIVSTYSTQATLLAEHGTHAAPDQQEVEVPDDTPLYDGVRVQQVSKNEGIYAVNGGSAEAIDQVVDGLDREATRHGWTQTESTKAEAIGGEGRVLKYKKGERTMEIYLAPGLDAPGTSVSINVAGEPTKG